MWSLSMVDKRKVGIKLESRKAGMGFLLGFPLLRSYRDEIESRKSCLPIMNNTKGSFGCRSTIGSPPQCHTFI